MSNVNKYACIFCNNIYNKPICKCTLLTSFLSSFLMLSYREVALLKTLLWHSQKYLNRQTSGQTPGLSKSIFKNLDFQGFLNKNQKSLKSYNFRFSSFIL